MLKQNICETEPVEEQVAVIFGVGKGLMDGVPVERIKEYEKRLVAYLRDLPSEGMAAIKESGKLEPETAEKLKAEIEGFNKNHWEKAEAEAAPA